MDAIVFGGGVAQGGFAAGAVAVLAEAGVLRVRRIVGTSSGALNAAYFARAVRDGVLLPLIGADPAGRDPAGPVRAPSQEHTRTMDGRLVSSEPPGPKPLT